jgi:hypothetical protein
MPRRARTATWPQKGGDGEGWMGCGWGGIGIWLFRGIFVEALLKVFDDVIETFNKDLIITVKRR